MAFNTANLVLLAHGNDKKLFRYDSSADNLAAIGASGYFNNTDDLIRMAVGDAIYVVASDGNANLKVTVVTSGAVTTAPAGEVTGAARIVTTTATALSLTLASHAERVLLVNTNSTVANTFTLPVATGSGAKMTIINNIAQTQGSVVIAANGTTDTIKGAALVVSATEEAAAAFVTSATSDKVTLNITTTGGGYGGDKVELWDSAANTWNVQVSALGNGTLATPFSAT